MNRYVVVFDGSVQENTSGAAFRIEAKDEEHAKQILQWLRMKVPACMGYIQLISTHTITINY